MIEITRKDFAKYVRVQKSGIVNMFDVNTVIELTDLPRKKITEIMKNYEAYERMWKK